MKQQTGMVLLLSLLLIIILSMTVSSAVNSILIDEKVILNQHTQLLTQQAAESALRTAERWLKAQITQPLVNTNIKNNVWTRNSPQKSEDKTQQWCLERDKTWWKQYATASQSIANSYYIIEHYENIADTVLTGDPNDIEQRVIYRITAMGNIGSSRVILQSLFAIRFLDPVTVISVPDLPLGRIAWQACY